MKQSEREHSESPKVKGIREEPFLFTVKRALTVRHTVWSLIVYSNRRD